MTAPFLLDRIADVQGAMKALSHVHGAYRATEILLDLLDGVEQTDQFDQDVRSLEGSVYEGPERAFFALAKATETAAHASDEQQRDALVELITLALTKFGASQGTRLFTLLLAYAGMHPGVAGIVLRVALLAAQTSVGKKWIAGSSDKLHVLTTRVIPAEQLAEIQASISDIPQELSAVFDRVSNASQQTVQGMVNQLGAGFEFLLGKPDRPQTQFSNDPSGRQRPPDAS